MWQRLERAIRGLGSGLAGLVYPARCFCCGEMLKGTGLCGRCEGQLNAIQPPFCSLCGEPHDGAIDGVYRCANCSGPDPAYEFAIAGYLATGHVRRLVHDFKYHRRLALRHTLAELAGAALDDSRIGGGEGWVLVPVPLHRRRRRERGYNQAAEIAGALAKQRGLKLCAALQRKRYTSAQARLEREERLANLRAAFALRPGRRVRSAIAGSRVLLVDDVFTTGATADACARVLREDGGAEKVVVATVARG